MNNLLVDLFKYRSREKREALEDWLTECVAAILRALPVQELEISFTAITGQNCRNVFATGVRPTIATQVVIERPRTVDAVSMASNGGVLLGQQRPDMIVSVDGHPWLVFENKVAHGLDESRSNDPRFPSQMERYGAWLQAEEFNPPGLAKALVFVTHFTPAPRGFSALVPRELGYRGLARKVVTWGALARVFDAASSELAADSYSRVLIDAFATFLKEHGMFDEYPATQDIALLGLQIGSTDRLKKLVNDMFVRIQGIGEWKGNTGWAEADVEFGRFNAWRYLHLPEGWPRDCYVNTGLWFPDSPNQQYRDAMDEELGVLGTTPISSAPKVFLQLAHADDGMFDKKGRPGDEWLRPVSDFFAQRDYDSFHGDPATRAVAIFAWLDERVAELREFLHGDGKSGRAA